MIAYVDASAAAKLLSQEAESAGVGALFDTFAEREETLLAGRLIETELRRIAVRESVSQDSVTQLLGRLAIVELDAGVYRSAGLLPGPRLRSLDALHLATALRVGADAMITFDERLEQACESVGLPVLAIPTTEPR